jgi:hypothetical protein
MRKSTTTYVLGLAVLLASVALPALAQDAPGRAKPHRRAPLRIEVTPSAGLYRQCTDWYVIEHRPTGDTVVPRMRCWWALR